MSPLRRAFLTTLLVLPAMQVSADPVTLTAAEVSALLSGRTAVGDWNGTPYRQYFDPNGRTVYQPKGGRPDEGKWRTSSATAAYESWWERSGWSGYAIAREQDTLYWVESSGKRHAFEVVDGRKLGF
ncbi:MAG: hypothetical protein AAFR79_14630 [Pseudomonadota bacterium]